jgi:nitrogen regulatory protein P-II 1
MKKVEAILTPYKLDAIKEMLKQHGCQEIVVSAVTGSGGGDGHLLYYQDAKYTPDLPRVRLEAVVLDTEAMPAVQDILRLSNGHTTADANVSADLLEQVVSIGISKLEPISTRRV